MLVHTRTFMHLTTSPSLTNNFVPFFIEINLSIQYILNCGTHTAGSCHGGSHSGAYQFVKEVGYVPFDSCMPYLACSHESKEGICGDVNTTCTAINTCRTCDTFAGMGGSCVEINTFPNATGKRDDLFLIEYV